jgi:hypothetical protein
MSVKWSIRAAPWIAVPAGAAVAVVLIAGCGGGSATTSGTNDPTVTSSGPIVKSNDEVTKSGESTEIEAGKFPNGQDNDEISPTGAEPVKPCVLVSRTEANHILGGEVRISEHPQGPTCVFSGSGREVTMVVMEASVKPLVQNARRSKALTVAGRPAWCLQYEDESVVADVGGGRVLQVTGACPAASRFAADAIPHIPS